MQLLNASCGVLVIQNIDISVSAGVLSTAPIVKKWASSQVVVAVGDNKIVRSPPFFKTSTFHQQFGNMWYWRPKVAPINNFGIRHMCADTWYRILAGREKQDFKDDLRSGRCPLDNCEGNPPFQHLRCLQQLDCSQRMPRKILKICKTLFAPPARTLRSAHTCA